MSDRTADKRSLSGANKFIMQVKYIVADSYIALLSLNPGQRVKDTSILVRVFTIVKPGWVRVTVTRDCVILYYTRNAG